MKAKEKVATKQTRTAYPTWWLWLIPVGLQMLFCWRGGFQVRYEEMAESVRNVYWFSHGLMYDYLSHNLGWYATIHWFNQLWGFSLLSARVYRVIVAGVAVGCWWWWLKQIYGNWKRALIPFFSVTLSPTLIYFNSLQALYGTDLVYIPIMLALATGARKWCGWRSYLAYLSLGWLMSLSFFTYSVFYFSLPWLLIGIGWVHWRSGKKWGILAWLMGAILPIIYLWPWLNQYRMGEFYLYLIKHGGQTYEHIPNLTDAWINLKHLARDLLLAGESYNFELKLADFSLGGPVLALGSALYLAIKYRLWWRRYWWVAGIILVAVVYNLYTIQYRNGPITDSGMRRSTMVLMASYWLYGLGWYLLTVKKNRVRGDGWLVILMCLLPLHHLLVYWPNWVAFGSESQFRTKLWWHEPELPITQVFEQRVEQLQQQPLSLNCGDLPPESWDRECRYQETWAALKLACEDKKLDCQPIYGYDPISQGLTEIGFDLWESGYWPR